MPIGILFWVLMVVWAVVGAWSNWGNQYVVGGNLLLWVIVALLGWHDFGPILSGR